MFTPSNLFLALILVNAWTFVMFGWDKIRAEAGHWRVAESTLLGIALVGGTAGAYAGRALFRHKTRKQPFGQNLQNIMLLQIVGITYAGVYAYAPI